MADALFVWGFAPIPCAAGFMGTVSSDYANRADVK